MDNLKKTIVIIISSVLITFAIFYFLNLLFPDYQIQTWFDKLLSFINTNSWQMVFITLVLSFRSQINSFLSKVNHFQYGDLSLTINDEMKEIQEELSEKTGIPQDILPSMKERVNVSISDQIGRVIIAWEKLNESIINNMKEDDYQKFKSYIDTRSVDKYIRENYQVIYPEYLDMRQIRNRSAHASELPKDFDIEQFENICRMMQEVVER
jgi:hypothetical protein